MFWKVCTAWTAFPNYADRLNVLKMRVLVHLEEKLECFNPFPKVGRDHERLEFYTKKTVRSVGYESLSCPPKAHFVRTVVIGLCAPF